jgi:hypothetical protein
VKKDQTPTLLKVVRWIFPKLELIAPYLAHRYFIKIFFTPLKYKIPEKEKPWIEKAEKFSIHAAGKKIQCYSWGSGPIVLLIHGWAGRATQFRKLIEVLVKYGYRVVGFDGPAHGQSEGKRTHIIEFEETISVLYKKIEEPVAVVCHSFGGSAALFAAMNGVPIKKLINIASPTMGDEIIKTYLRAINGSSSTGDFFKKYIKETQGRDFNEFTAMHFIRQLPQEINLLLVYDEDDKDVIIKQALELKKAYPKATLYTTKGLSHTRILKDETVIGNIVTFIREGRLNREGTKS